MVHAYAAYLIPHSFVKLVCGKANLVATTTRSSGTLIMLFLNMEIFLLMIIPLGHLADGFVCPFCTLPIQNCFENDIS
jgi:hypothetical protein